MKLNPKTISNTGPNLELTDQPKAFSRAKFLCKCRKCFWKVKIVKNPINNKNTFPAKPRAQKTKSQFNGEFSDYQNLKLHQKKPKIPHNILVPIPNPHSSLHFHCHRPRAPIRGPIFLDLHILIRWKSPQKRQQQQHLRQGAELQFPDDIVVVRDDADVVYDWFDSGEEVLQRGEGERVRRWGWVVGDAWLPDAQDAIEEASQAPYFASR